MSIENSKFLLKANIYLTSVSVEYIQIEQKQYEREKKVSTFLIDQEHSENTHIYKFVRFCKMQQQHWWISPL